MVSLFHASDASMKPHILPTKAEWYGETSVGNMKRLQVKQISVARATVRKPSREQVVAACRWGFWALTIVMAGKVFSSLVYVTHT